MRGRMKLTATCRGIEIVNEEKSKSLDILGVKPVSDAINTVTKASVDGASKFLGKICLPAAEEFGFLLKDKVSNWRAKNALAVVQKAEKKLLSQPSAERKHAHPRLVIEAFEKGSWAENETVQEMWAGLLASSCTEDGADDSNLIFIDLLSQLTTVQAQLLKYVCETTIKYVSPAGWPYAGSLDLTLEQLTNLTGVDDFHRLDREIDHLRSLQLIGGNNMEGENDGGGFMADSQDAKICPTALALHLYVRCQGYTGSPVEFFNLKSK
jgi:abortive infection alpha-like protein